MDVLKVILMIIFAIDCIALTTIVLLQEGKSAGLGTISGVGNASQVMPLYGSGRSRISCRYVWKAV